MTTDATPRPIRLLVVDDHPMVRAGIGALISGQSDMVVAAEAENGEEAVAQFESLRPDVTLMDLQMPQMSGMTAMERILQKDSSARIIVLTTYRGDAQASRALRVGASGYLLKNAIRQDLLTAIRTVHAGRRFLAPEVAMELSLRRGEDELSPREIEVLTQVAAGGANWQVADRLGVSEETVKTHLKSIFSKLGVADRVQAVVVAMRRGILTDELRNF